MRSSRLFFLLRVLFHPFFIVLFFEREETPKEDSDRGEKHPDFYPDQNPVIRSGFREKRKNVSRYNDRCDREKPPATY